MSKLEKQMLVLLLAIFASIVFCVVCIVSWEQNKKDIYPHREGADTTQSLNPEK